MKQTYVTLSLIIGLILLSACQTTVHHNEPLPAPIVQKPLPPQKTTRVETIEEETTETIEKESTIVD